MALMMKGLIPIQDLYCTDSYIGFLPSYFKCKVEAMP